MLRRLICGVMFVGAAFGSIDGVPRPIYRCEGAAGEVMFTDLPCRGGRAQTNDSAPPIHFAVPNEAERATLERVARERATLRRAERARASKAAAAQSRASIQNERRCAAARAGLERVHAAKRRGYRASRGAALAARERGYQAQRDRHCVGYPH